MGGDTFNVDNVSAKDLVKFINKTRKGTTGSKNLVPAEFGNGLVWQKRTILLPKLTLDDAKRILTWKHNRDKHFRCACTKKGLGHKEYRLTGTCCACTYKVVKFDHSRPLPKEIPYEESELSKFQKNVE